MFADVTFGHGMLPVMPQNFDSLEVPMPNSPQDPSTTHPRDVIAEDWISPFPIFCGDNRIFSVDSGLHYTSPRRMHGDKVGVGNEIGEDGKVDAVEAGHLGMFRDSSCEGGARNWKEESATVHGSNLGDLEVSMLDDADSKKRLFDAQDRRLLLAVARLEDEDWFQNPSGLKQEGNKAWPDPRKYNPRTLFLFSLQSPVRRLAIAGSPHNILTFPSPEAAALKQAMKRNTCNKRTYKTCNISCSCFMQNLNGRN